MLSICSAHASLRRRNFRVTSFVCCCRSVIERVGFSDEHAVSVAARNNISIAVADAVIFSVELANAVLVAFRNNLPIAVVDAVGFTDDHADAIPKSDPQLLADFLIFIQRFLDS